MQNKAEIELHKTVGGMGLLYEIKVTFIIILFHLVFKINKAELNWTKLNTLFTLRFSVQKFYDS